VFSQGVVREVALTSLASPLIACDGFWLGSAIYGPCSPANERHQSERDHQLRGVDRTKFLQLDTHGGIHGRTTTCFVNTVG